MVCDALDYHALKMVSKDETTLPRYRSAFNFFRKIGPTPKNYINERALADFMLDEESALLYVGGAGCLYGLRRGDSDPDDACSDRLCS